jgi:hypothetical protein
LGLSGDDNGGRSEQSRDVTKDSVKGDIIMKLRYLAPVAVAASAAVIGLAPVAMADTTVHHTPGGAEIVATPGQSAQNAAQLQQPFGGNSGALLYHH